VFDRLDRGLPSGFGLPNVVWRRREIENYLCMRDVLLRYAEGMEPDDLVGRALVAQRREEMSSAINVIEDALRKLRKDAWSPDMKVSDDFLPAVFDTYFMALGTDNRMNKTNFHVLADFVAADEVDPEIIACLDKIVETASAVSASATAGI
jgi:hypothetical protein